MCVINNDSRTESTLVNESLHSLALPERVNKVWG